MPRALEGWGPTVAVAGAVLALALVYRAATRPAPSVLPRTEALVEQKVGSLAAYNEEMTEGELLAFYERHLGVPVQPAAFSALTEQVVDSVLPRLWAEAEARTEHERFILTEAMAEAIQARFPHETLTNADVIVFPGSEALRVVVAEPAGDFFRDSGWHWRWIGAFLERAAASSRPPRRELDIYAAEELSEFLSVLGVAAVDLAARGGASPVDAGAIDAAFAAMAAPEAVAPPAEGPPRGEYSAETRRRLLASLPDPMFREITAEAGLTFVHRPNEAHWRRRATLEVPLGIAGGGVSAGDFDGDGQTDLYFAGDEGGALLRRTPAGFVDVSRAVGLPAEGETRAGYFVDYDNDGDRDLFVTRVGAPHRLLENRDGQLLDVTAEVALRSGDEITHEAVWVDYDNDGWLDVYTANFGPWLDGAVPTIGRNNDNAPPNQLYHHVVRDGRHTFEEVAAELGVDDRGWTHCVGALDYDRDGWVDLFSLNDFGASLVYRNEQGRGFREVSRQLRMDDVYNAMSFTLVDLEGTDRPAIYISQIMKLTHRQRYRKPSERTKMVFGEDNLDNLRVLVKNRLFAEAADGAMVDEHDLRIEPADLGWAWDVSALDYENDADLDLIVLNGTERDIPSSPDARTKKHVLGRSYLSAYSDEANVVYVQEQGYFYDVSARSPLAFEGNSRGSAFFDYDGDGDLDVAVSNYDGPAQLFENLQAADHHWVRLQLRGRRSNRDAVGAQVRLRFAGEERRTDVVSGSGFLSQDPYTLHFGLGTAGAVDEVRIRWPSGAEQVLTALPVDQRHVIEEPPADAG